MLGLLSMNDMRMKRCCNDKKLQKSKYNKSEKRFRSKKKRRRWKRIWYNSIVVKNFKSFQCNLIWFALTIVPVTFLKISGKKYGIIGVRPFRLRKYKNWGQLFQNTLKFPQTVKCAFITQKNVKFVNFFAFDSTFWYTFIIKANVI